MGAASTTRLATWRPPFYCLKCVYSQFILARSKSGLEFAAVGFRAGQNARGGDRPKNAEQEFPDVCWMPAWLLRNLGAIQKAVTVRDDGSGMPAHTSDWRSSP